jgi:hypothetical protein
VSFADRPSRKRSVARRRATRRLQSTEGLVGARRTSTAACFCTARRGLTLWALDRAAVPLHDSMRGAPASRYTTQEGSSRCLVRRVGRLAMVHATDMERLRDSRACGAPPPAAARRRSRRESSPRRCESTSVLGCVSTELIGCWPAAGTLMRDGGAPLSSRRQPCVRSRVLMPLTFVRARASPRSSCVGLWKGSSRRRGRSIGHAALRFNRVRSPGLRGPDLRFFLL